MTEAEKVVSRLTKDQVDCVIGCEHHGNGRWPYALHGLAKAGVMSLQTVIKPDWPDGYKAYRLTPLGLEVRIILKGQDDEK